MELGRYNSILMDNYGEPIVENGQVIGYKIFKDEGVVVKDVEDENGVKSNLVTVKEIINGKLVVDDSNDFIQWRDTKTPRGFTCSYPPPPNPPLPNPSFYFFS